MFADDKNRLQNQKKGILACYKLLSTFHPALPLCFWSFCHYGLCDLSLSASLTISLLRKVPNIFARKGSQKAGSDRILGKKGARTFASNCNLSSKIVAKSEVKRWGWEEKKVFQWRMTKGAFAMISFFSYRECAESCLRLDEKLIKILKRPLRTPHQWKCTPLYLRTQVVVEVIS